MTDKEAKAFYNAAAWKHKRMQILERDHYECQDCRKRLKDAVAAGHILQGEDRKIRRAEEVHHIVELKEHPELGLEDDNLINGRAVDDNVAVVFDVTKLEEYVLPVTQVTVPQTKE